MTTREEIVYEARSWIDTPWHHQASLKGVGCDCGGIIRGVMKACGMAPMDESQWEDAQKYSGYARQPDGVSMKEACDKYLVPISQDSMQVADIILFIPDKYPQHLGILADYVHGGFSLIHAANNAAPPRVIETRLMFHRCLRYVAAYSLPGVA